MEGGEADNLEETVGGMMKMAISIIKGKENVKCFLSFLLGINEMQKKLNAVSQK